jgi:hypothetical protein
VGDPPELPSLAKPKLTDKLTITKMMRTRKLRMRRRGMRPRVLRMTLVLHRSGTSRGNSKNSASSR